MAPFPLNSYTTALVILAPPHLHPAINAIRATNDKSYPRWQPHLTLIFPFAAPEHLPLAISRLRESLAEAKAEAFRLRLDSVARFQQRNYDTVYLGPSHDAEIRKVWNVAAGTMGYTGRDFVPHLTLGQSPTQQQSLDFLGRKAEKLKDSGTLEWVVDRLVVLKKSELDGGAMAVYEEILLAPSTSVTSSPTPPRPIEQPYPTFHFTGNQWTVFAPPAPPTVNSTLSVATFNILDSSFHPQHNRFHPLKRAILSANADIICLQEVTSSFLPLLLNDEEIQRAYGFCNRNGDKMENERNIVVFSRFGFGWEAVGLGTKHKEAHILTFQRPLSSSPDSELIVAAVHLSAGLSAALIERKLAELDNLVSELTKNHPRSPWIVTGDFNLPSTISTSPPLPAVLSDVWNLLRSEDSATYDPSSNPLAAEVVASIPHATIEPQRFDRMFIKSDMGDLNVVDVKLFGFPDKGEVGSDHWGLVSRFAFEGPGYSESGDKQNALEVIPTQLTSDDLLSTLLAQNFLPTPTTSQSHESAFTTISSLLSSTSPPLHVVKVGSTAIGVETEGSDIDCLCISNFNANTFWEVVKGRIRGDNNEGGAVKLRKFVKEAAVKMMELDVGGIKIDLQYCCAPKLVDIWDELPSLPTTSDLFSLPSQSLRTLNAHRDVLFLLSSIPPSTLVPFQLAHRSIKLWSVQRGVWGSRFGYFGGFWVSILLARLVLLLRGNHSLTATDLIRAFFYYYARFEWESDMVEVNRGSERVYRRSGREAMVILSIQRPSINVAANATRPTMLTLSKELKRADNMLERSLQWNKIVSEENNGAKEFLQASNNYIVLKVSYWGGSRMKCRGLLGWLESRLVNLLVRLSNDTSPSTEIRLWPGRFTTSLSTSHDNETRSDLNALYIVSLSSSAALPNINQTLKKYEDDIRSTERYFDKSEMYVSVELVRREDLHRDGDITLDNDEWERYRNGEFGIEGLEDDDESDEALDPETDELRPSEIQFESSKSRKSSRKAPVPTSSSSSPKTKLRTSTDVFNRLMWDPVISKEDYVIGYEDRFLGVKEMPLSNWKREVEDEEFIPFHRVVHFRRKSDNVKVWDRKSRTDLLFGSGEGPGKI